MCNILATGAVCCYSTHSKHCMKIIVFDLVEGWDFFFATSIEDSMVWKCENLTFCFWLVQFEVDFLQQKKKTRGFFSDHTHVSRWSPSHGELICTESPWSKSGPFRRQDWPGGKNGGWGDRRCLDQLSSRRLSLPGPPSKEGKSLILGKSRWVKY